jgi:hypothetical protein
MDRLYRFEGRSMASAPRVSNLAVARFRVHHAFYQSGARTTAEKDLNQSEGGTPCQNVSN